MRAVDVRSGEAVGATEVVLSTPTASNELVELAPGFA